VIVFVGGTGDGELAHAIRPDGTDLRPLPLPERCDEPVELAPDGATVLCWRYGGPRGRSHLEAVELDGGGFEHVRLPVGENIWPELSPDGEHVVFLHARGEAFDVFELWRARRDGSGARRLVAEDSGPATWSPDGERLAFVRVAGGPGCGGDLVVMDADGGEQHVIARRSSLPQWSPDGTRIAFLGGACDDPALWTVPANGGEPTLVAPNAFGAHTVAWSPDGTQIAFVRRAKPLGPGWSVRIVVAPANGGAPRPIGPLVADSPAAVFWLPTSAAPGPSR